MAVAVEELVVTLTARMDQYNLALRTAQVDTDRRMAAIEGRFNTMNSRLKSSVSGAAASIGGLGGLLTSITAAFGTQQLVEYADAWRRVNRALESSEQVFGISLANGEQVARMAIETRSNLEEISKLYIRTAAAAAKLGLDTSVAAEVTTTFAKALKLGQASTAEQTSAIGQFSQALQKGTLNGDEFRTIMESAGVVQQALIEKFKVSGATLIKMAEDGKISAKDMIAALQQVKPQIDEAFGRSAVTVTEAWENLRTAISVTLGKWNEAQGVTKGLADGIQVLANNLENLVKLMAVFGTLGLTVVFSKMAAGFGALAASASAGAVGLGAVGVAALALGTANTAIQQFGAEWTVIADRGITVRDIYRSVGSEIGGAFSSAMGVATEAVGLLADVVLDALSAMGSLKDGAGGSSAQFAYTVRRSINDVIGAFVGASNAIAASLLTVFGSLPSQITALLNLGLESLETFVRGAAGALNFLPGVKIDVDAIQIARMPDLFGDATAKAQELWADASRAMGRDYLSEMGAAIDTVKGRILDDAQARAIERGFQRGTTVKREIEAKPVYSDPAAGAKKYEDAVTKMREHTSALIADARAVGLGAAERERAAAMHDLLTAAKKNEIAVTPELLSQMDALARGYGQARGQLEYLQALQRTKDETASLKSEIALTGLYGLELHKARVEMELLAEAKKAGIAVTDVMRAEIAQTAAASAAMKQLNESIAAVRDTSRAALSGFINDLRSGKSGAEALSGALGKIADKLVDMAANSLVEAALGGLFKGASGGGGLLGSLFSGGGSLPAFANGGVMTANGPRALNRFAGGGVSNRAAIFGEAGPEAAVPLPDGRRIPVELRLPNINNAAQRAGTAAQGASVAVTVAPVFHVGGKVSAEDLASLESRVAKSLPGVAKQAVSQALERQPGFGRKGV